MKLSKITRIYNSIVLFLDVLGFSSQILNGSDERFEKIIEMLEEIEQELKMIERESEYKYIMNTTIFSDSIIVSIRYPKDVKKSVDSEWAKAMMGLTVVAGYFQLKLLENGFISRGHICDGNKMYHDENICVGVPFIEAYRQEQRLGNLPIITIDNKSIMSEINISEFKEKDQISFLRMVSNIDNDKWYIDILGATMESVFFRIIDFQHIKKIISSSVIYHKKVLSESIREDKKEKQKVVEKWSFFEKIRE